jgi:hypothetical protein
VHRAFREGLVLGLLEDPTTTNPTQVYVTKNTALPRIRLTRPIEIHRREFGKRAPCVFYRWSRVTKKGRTEKVITKSRNVYKTTLVCSHCSINLCLDCFDMFHHYIE